MWILLEIYITFDAIPAAINDCIRIYYIARDSLIQKSTIRTYKYVVNKFGTWDFSCVLILVEMINVVLYVNNCVKYKIWILNF